MLITLTQHIYQTLLMFSQQPGQTDTAYSEGVYGDEAVTYGGIGVLDSPIPGIPSTLPNTGREMISFVVALGLFAAGYLIIKKHYDRSRNH